MQAAGYQLYLKISESMKSSETNINRQTNELKPFNSILLQMCMFYPGFAIILALWVIAPYFTEAFI